GCVDVLRAGDRGRHHAGADLLRLAARHHALVSATAWPAGDGSRAAGDVSASMLDMFLSAAFWVGLGQIAYLNLLLSGDNALVVALAVRTLPKRKRALGQIWGAAGAVALRLAFLAIVMYLLEVRFLRLTGGLLLIWIAYKLVQSETGVESEVKGGASLWEAIWIIIVADVTMSLDNVL